ncbi:nicotinamidase [Schizosaccharomyces cryophilus OY26]|uniref:nicotinamidase n=1 Tax=Schizosaccharomyces cryophilus (strain OY26 / ATCC MYA-4695 / CBS 11777 / NBRC 106824 / NRRL Y48691) TaxID=653667 RepID=S9VZL5_SCHCR|nr:nicotinamidase [Schizosaccharomyces cryophilus OY26]EPY51659.1 nicotinamidase [Schizosaccharomyces cryophilus OY26]
MDFNPALIIVDMQNDFVTPEFAGHLPGATSIIPNINELLSDNFKWDYTVATKDLHPADHASFRTSHGPSVKPKGTVIEINAHGKTYKQQLWLSHCVNGTAGAEFHPDLRMDKVDFILPKGTDTLVESYSGFYDAIGRDNGLKKMLDERNITDIFVVGVAGDVCVRDTALHAKEHYRTYVIEDGICMSTEESGQKTLREFHDAGISLIKMNDPLLEFVKNRTKSSN